MTINDKLRSGTLTVSELRQITSILPGSFTFRVNRNMLYVICSGLPLMPLDDLGLLARRSAVCHDGVLDDLVLSTSVELGLSAGEAESINEEGTHVQVRWLLEHFVGAKEIADVLPPIPGEE